MRFAPALVQLDVAENYLNGLRQKLDSERVQLANLQGQANRHNDREGFAADIEASQRQIQELERQTSTAERTKRRAQETVNAIREDMVMGRC